MTSSVPEWLQAHRASWKNRGTTRPEFAREPGPGQESVWDYPRPPAIVADQREVTIVTDGLELARTREAIRICETASPPAFYLPPESVRTEMLQPSANSSFCEWKGPATYWMIGGSGTSQSVGWSYPKPLAGSETIAGYFSFYPGRIECFVDGERVRPQAGEFYGGWITNDVVGPFKGDPGTGGW